MKKIYSFMNGRSLSLLVLSFLLSSTGWSQSICGGIVENFDNAGGSTAGYTGSFSYGSTGANGYLVKNKILPGIVYTITTPTYQLPAGTDNIGYGFTLDGTENVARVEVRIMFFSTITQEVETYFVGQFVPSYDPGTTAADVCRAVSTNDFPGFPSGGKYRLVIDLTPNTGAGSVDQTITFDDYRTNGSFSQSPLPVTFMGFDAKKVNASVQLTWKVAGEENVSHYEVERSGDGRGFTNIGTVTKTGQEAYTFTDVNSSSVAYYRIKNVDNDGKYKYSTIVRLANGRSDIVLRAFPQPVQSQLTLQHPTVNGRALVSINTADGRVVRSFVPATGSMQTGVDMSGLQAGMYLLRYNDGTGNVQTLKVLKQ